MFIAHIPMGLLLAQAMTKTPLSRQAVLAAGTGAVFPDIDLLRFYFLDNHQRHHHEYWTHIPVIWIGIILLWFCLTKFLRPSFSRLSRLFFACVFLHLVLDTMAGNIEWLWPFSSGGFQFVTVPATHAQWYLSFVHHWTFKLEIFISLLAILVAGFDYGHKASKIPCPPTG